MKKFNYENDQYLVKLNELSSSFYSKYIKFIKKYSIDSKSKFLDVGCGTGTVLQALIKSGYKNVYGVDVSKLFVEDAKAKGLRNVKYYDGKKFPYNKNYFDLVGSFNVLEHTDNPEDFIKQQVSILKPGGYIIVSCPNFLSVLFYNPHRRLKGIRNKTNNFLTILKKIIIPDKKFTKMKPLIRKKFEYDDDAIVVTNLLDLKKALHENNCAIVYQSGFINYDTALYKAINFIPFIKYMLPSCFVVARKQ